MTSQPDIILIGRIRTDTQRTMMKASAFAPGHLTGFFEICDNADNYLLKGARGAGFSISHGVYTDVEAEPAEKNSVTVTINGEVDRSAKVSETVVKRMLSILDTPYLVKVDHNIQIPVGAGFGTSGGGALSLALALNEALGLQMSRIEAAQVAHIAEIECGTGLGTVLAELTGGFGVTVKAGGPGIGETVKFNSSGLSAICLPIGPMPTKAALANQELRRRINELGGRFVDELQEDQSRELFMKLSRIFAEHIGIITPRLRAVFDLTDKDDVKCSMAMFGEVIFALVESEQDQGLVDILRVASPGRKVLTTGIDEKGARLI